MILKEITLQKLNKIRGYTIFMAFISWCITLHKGYTLGFDNSAFRNDFGLCIILTLMLILAMYTHRQAEKAEK